MREIARSRERERERETQLSPYVRRVCTYRRAVSGVVLDPDGLTPRLDSLNSLGTAASTHRTGIEGK